MSGEKDGALEAHSVKDGGHLTKTQRDLLRFIAGETALHGGVCCSKRELAERLGRNVKTIDRCLSDLRRRGIVSVEMRFSESGGQIENEYRVVMGTGA